MKAIMINKMFVRAANLLFIICMIAFILSLVGCDHIDYTSIAYSGGDNYKTFVTPKGDDFPLSFEYPSYYKLGYETRTPGGTYVHLNGIPFKDFYGGSIKGIDIQVRPIVGDFPDAETAVKNQIAYIRGSWYRNYRLIEKHKITTTEGLEGWEIVITYREQPIPMQEHGMPRDPAFVVYRELFFDNNDIFCSVRLYTDANSYKQTKVEFEHIIRTLEGIKYMSFKRSLVQF
jgi:hypothetical protein